MNYRMLFFAAIMVSNTVFAFTNKSLINDFKEDLFFCQSQLVADKKLYYQFIDPYIQEAAQGLVIIKYISTEALSWDEFGEYSRSPFYEYGQALVSYNCAYFNAYVRGETASYALMCAKQKLRASIVRIKKETVLSDLDIDKEFNQTMQLFQRANIVYYKTLSLFQKLKIKMVSIF